MENGDFGNGGMPDWGTGMGMLSVYVDDMHTPVLVVPLNLDATLDLASGRAYVGFTAATGDNVWQVHDILDWRFSSLRVDPPYYPPEILNGRGSYSCKRSRFGGSSGSQAPLATPLQACCC